MYTYNVFEDVNRLRDLFDDFFNDKAGTTPTREYPPVRIHESNDTIGILALVPGIKSEDIDIQLIDDRIIITGEKKNDHQDHPYIRRERVFGEFKRSIKLPYRVKADEVKAELTNGLLAITLAKADEVKPKKIAIN